MGSQTNHKKRGLAIVAAVMLAMLALAGSAFANQRNSMQPAHVYFGTVVSGQHPNRIVVLHNGTGQKQDILNVWISGSGGYIFTLPINTAALKATGLPTCRPWMPLDAGASCAVDVRVHTVRAGWWRSVLRIQYANGWFNSSELRAHVVAS